MRIKKIISKSPDGSRMEIIGDDNRTHHIHKTADGWLYSVGNKKFAKVENYVGGQE